MPKITKILNFFYAGFFILLFSATSAKADCLTECMNVTNCWGGGDDPGSSYCRGTEGRCEAQCRDEGNAKSNRKSYGAIAYSKKDGGFGYSDTKKNQKQAEKTALAYCRDHGKKCKIAVWFYNQCGAVAADGRKIGKGLRESAAAANEDALKECRKGGKKNCEVKVSHCSF